MEIGAIESRQSSVVSRQSLKACGGEPEKSSVLRANKIQTIAIPSSTQYWVTLGVTISLIAFQNNVYAATRLFGTTGAGGASTLVELNPTTGALLSTIGPVGYAVNGLEYDSTTNKFYASTSINDASFPNGLIEINITTGAGTQIGLCGMKCNNLTVNSAGQMFGWTENGDDLISLNKTTGAATVVGNSGMGTSQYGLAFAPNGTLYYVGPGNIRSLDTTTGIATLVTNALANVAHHGDFNPDTGQYWGIDRISGNPRNLLVVDVTTGAISSTLPTVDSLHTITFGPPETAVEPEEPKEPSKPGLPPLPSTMNLEVDTSSSGLGFVEVYWGRNYPGTDSKLGSCKQGDSCLFTVETATWISLKPFAASGYQFKNQWSGSSSCNSGNPFMINNMTCKPGFSALPPESPATLSATAVSDVQIDLLWRDNSTRETGYIIERSSDQTTWVEIAKTTANSTTHSDLGLTCGETYYYRVTGYNNSGKSAPSNIISAVTACPVPPPVEPSPPVVDPVPPPVVPPTPPVTEPTPPTPPVTEPTPPPPEVPPTEPPVVQPPEPPTTPDPEPPVEPTLPPVQPEPVEPPAETTDTSTQETAPPVAEQPCPTDRHYNVHLDEACDAEGQTIENFKIVYGGSLSDANITGKLISENGLVSNLTIESKAILEGGYVTNVIINKGLMKNFTFVGQQIKGGQLAGKIIIASQVTNEIRDVILAAGTVIQGKVGKPFVTAKLAGKIKGNAADPALLENVTIENAELENVVLGEGVIIGQNVKQKNVVVVCTSKRANGKGFDKNGSPFDDAQTCFVVQENAIALTLDANSPLLEQTAEPLFVVIHGQKAFMFTDHWQEWDGELATLQPAQSLTVKSTQTLGFPKMSDFEGEFKFYVGLRLKSDGTIMYHQVQ